MHLETENEMIKLAGTLLQTQVDIGTSKICYTLAYAKINAPKELFNFFDAQRREQTLQKQFALTNLINQK